MCAELFAYGMASYSLFVLSPFPASAIAIRYPPGVRAAATVLGETEG